MVESVLTFAMFTRFGSLSLGDQKRLEHIVTGAVKSMASNYPMCLKPSIRESHLRLWTVSYSVPHPLYAEFELLPSGRRFTLPGVKSNRLKSSFITQAITQLNFKNHDAVLSISSSLMSHNVLYVLWVLPDCKAYFPLGTIKLKLKKKWQNL